MQRANVLLKQGKLQEAEEDYTEVVSRSYIYRHQYCIETGILGRLETGNVI